MGGTSAVLEKAQAALDMIREAPLDRFFEAMATRLNAEKAEGKEMIVNMVFTDLDQTYGGKRAWRSSASSGSSINPWAISPLWRLRGIAEIANRTVTRGHSDKFDVNANREKHCIYMVLLLFFDF